MAEWVTADKLGEAEEKKEEKEKPQVIAEILSLIHI